LLLDYKSLKNNFGLDAYGVLHIGAHFGQEYGLYKEDGIKNLAFFEPLSKNFKELKKRVPEEKGVKFFNVALGSKAQNVEMFVEAANQGQSSSVLEPDLHLQQYPHITFDEKESVEMRTLDSFLEEKELESSLYNLINMDVQGYELEVLRGAKKFLTSIDFIITEVNRANVYKGCALVEELDAFLLNYGFYRAETSWEGVTWGDAFYIKAGKRGERQ
tara:strand:+ start:108 stop:758 length:651 start_codon:yes stop_codon:yes gene_type:complete